MGSASTHRVGHPVAPERVQFTVAELLDRCGEARDAGVRNVGVRSGQVDSVPAGRLRGAGSARRRWAAAAGTVVVAGTLAAGAILSAQPTHGGGPMGAEAAGAGHPVEPPRTLRPRAAVPEPTVTTVARIVPVRPAAPEPVRRPAPKTVAPDVPENRDVPDERRVRAPAGSGSNGLDPTIGRVDALLGAATLDELPIPGRGVIIVGR